YSFAGIINQYKSYDITSKYRDNFIPAAHKLGDIHSKLMLSLSIYCADTVEDAGKLAAPMMVMMQRLRQGDMNSPIETEDNAVSLLGGVPSSSILSDGKIPPRYIIGTPDTIQTDLIEIAAAFDVDEIMVQCISHNMANRLKCLKMLAEVFDLKK